ncbi:protein FAM83A-like [Astyanax mexicanus]|uniref:Protein FAM83A-like n=1 Tax=Astyanax mexicanus TaxID=7994 RepID=A0A8T2MNU7_ASTMX|nr:protein FAM83A-like [Astyanax mexicanus]
MQLDSNGLSVQCYLKPRIMGKVRRRLQEMRSPSTQTSTMDLSHNESARMATDALLDQGLKAYKEVLSREEEADFLSMEEKGYILGNLKEPGINSVEEVKEEEMSCSSSESSSQTYFPMVSESEAPCLEMGWPVADWSYHLQGAPSVEVYFQSHHSASVKDLLREFIRKARTVLAIVMDTFSDVEIFCDILEATKKRNVSVYLLLDHINLQVFKEMCANLQINKSHLTHMSIRSICGETYCSKSGRKFTGQVKEKFVIIDCTHVLVGTYSFTWLSWQVHKNMVMLFKGASVKAFDIEFRRLYAASKPVPEFSTAAGPDDRLSPLPHFIQPLTAKFLTGRNANMIPQAGVSHPSHLPHLQKPSSPTLPVIPGLYSQQFLNTRPLLSLWRPQRIHQPAVGQRFLPRNYNNNSGNVSWHLQNNNYHYQFLHGAAPLSTPRFSHTKANCGLFGEQH